MLPKLFLLPRLQGGGDKKPGIPSGRLNQHKSIVLYYSAVWKSGQFFSWPSPMLKAMVQDLSCHLLCSCYTQIPFDRSSTESGNVNVNWPKHSQWHFLKKKIATTTLIPASAETEIGEVVSMFPHSKRMAEKVLWQFVNKGN